MELSESGGLLLDTDHRARGFSNDRIHVCSQASQGFLHHTSANYHEIGAILYGGLPDDGRYVASIQRDFEIRASLLLQLHVILAGHIKQGGTESSTLKIQTSRCRSQEWRGLASVWLLARERIRKPTAAAAGSSM